VGAGFVGVLESKPAPAPHLHTRNLSRVAKPVTIPTHFTSEAGSSIHTNPSTPTNVASHRTSITPGAGSYIYTNPLTPTSVASRSSSLIVEADEDEFACSDFDDPEFLEQLDAVLASQPSPN
jgi:hypothetical protein